MMCRFFIRRVKLPNSFYLLYTLEEIREFMVGNYGVKKPRARFYYTEFTGARNTINRI
jgi:hypothetical protein